MMLTKYHQVFTILTKFYNVDQISITRQYKTMQTMQKMHTMQTMHDISKLFRECNEGGGRERKWAAHYILEWYGNHAPLARGLLNYTIPSVPRKCIIQLQRGKGVEQ